MGGGGEIKKLPELDRLIIKINDIELFYLQAKSMPIFKK
jgi:hypothetical protein